MQSLARYEAGAEPVDGPPNEILDEASFRAAREGVAATLPDDEDELRPVAELLERMIEQIRPAARELRCEAQIDDLSVLLDCGGGAGIQRSAGGGGDGDGEDAIQAVLDALLARAEPTDGDGYSSTDPMLSAG